MNYQEIFKKIWNDYSLQNPSVSKIYKLFIDAGEQIQNDHIAFRTCNNPRIDVNVLAGVFLKNGYIERGDYIFEEKHLYAKHFEHSTDEYAPRIFISQIILEKFSPYLQQIIRNKIDNLPDQIFVSPELIVSGHLFSDPSFKVYNKLREESEYAAWLYVFGIRANHFTISINALKKYNTIEKVNEFVKSNGFKLNAVGGEIKGTKDELLRQSSTLADHVKIKFIEGYQEIPSCYYEFAQRYFDKDGKLYSGFIPKSADKIFESTNFYKK